MQGNWKIGSNDRDEVRVSIPSLVCVEAAHNPAAAVQPFPTRRSPDLLPDGGNLSALTSFEIAKEGCTLGWLTMLRAGLNNIIPVNHVGQRDAAPGQLSGKVRSYR